MSKNGKKNAKIVCGVVFGVLLARLVNYCDNLHFQGAQLYLCAVGLILLVVPACFVANILGEKAFPWIVARVKGKYG